jgi:group I intron endonuclease
MAISGIYQIQSKIKPERIYIGSSVNIQRRWRDHLYLLKKNKHDNQRLQHHYNKYGKNDFVFSIIIGCGKDDLVTTEQFYIDSIKCWFNLCPKAGNTLGVRFSEESKERSRRATLGRKHPIESRKQRSLDSIGEKNHFFGKHHTAESNQKRREWNLSHPSSKEAHRKQRESLLKTIELKKLLIANQN